MGPWCESRVLSSQTRGAVSPWELSTQYEEAKLYIRKYCIQTPDLHLGWVTFGTPVSIHTTVIGIRQGLVYQSPAQNLVQSKLGWPLLSLAGSPS